MSERMILTPTDMEMALAHLAEADPETRPKIEAIIMEGYMQCWEMATSGIRDDDALRHLLRRGVELGERIVSIEFPEAGFAPRSLTVSCTPPEKVRVLWRVLDGGEPEVIAEDYWKPLLLQEMFILRAMLYERDLTIADLQKGRPS